MSDKSIDQLIAEAVEKETERCAKLICRDCASGNIPDKRGWHILETVQGCVFHDRYCPALIFTRSELKSPQDTPNG